MSERGAEGMAALDYDGRIGFYTVLVPGFDEAENVEDCFDDFDGLMHDLEEMMDRREQLMHVLELMETEPTRSRLREYLGEEEDEALGIPADSLARRRDEAEDDDKAGTAQKTRPTTQESASPPDREKLMAELKQAMSDGDEARVEALFRQVQQLS